MRRGTIKKSDNRPLVGEVTALSSVDSARFAANIFFRRDLKSEENFDRGEMWKRAEIKIEPAENEIQDPPPTREKTFLKQYGLIPQRGAGGSLCDLMQRIRENFDSKLINTIVSLYIGGAFGGAWWPVKGCPIDLTIGGGRTRQ